MALVLLAPLFVQDRAHAGERTAPSALMETEGAGPAEDRGLQDDSRQDTAVEGAPEEETAARDLEEPLWLYEFYGREPPEEFNEATYCD